jgi:hypothetical protein
MTRVEPLHTEAYARALAHRIGEQLRSEGLPVMGADQMAGETVLIAFRMPNGKLWTAKGAVEAADPERFRAAYREQTGA